MSSENKNENGSSNVTIGSLPTNGSEQVIANALTTFALQVPNTVQTTVRNGTMTIISTLLAVSVLMCSLSLYFYNSINRNVEDIHILYRKMDDRHQRLIQYAKDNDYRILSKEPRK